jgi:GTP-binding protein
MSSSWEELPPMFLTSAEKRTGRVQLLSFIDEMNAQAEIPKKA